MQYVMRCDGTRWDAMRCDVMDGLRLFVCTHTYVHTYIGKIHAYMHAPMYTYTHTYTNCAHGHTHLWMLHAAVQVEFLDVKVRQVEIGYPKASLWWWMSSNVFHWQALPGEADDGLSTQFCSFYGCGSAVVLLIWTSWCRCLFCRESDGPGMQSVHHLEWSERNYSDRGVIRFGRNELV